MDRKVAAGLKNSVAWIRAGQTDKARKFLVELLRREPENAQAWYLLSYTLDDPQRRQYALLQAVQIDPEFLLARKRLAKLRGDQIEEEAPAVSPPAAPPVPAPLTVTQSFLAEAQAENELRREPEAELDPKEKPFARIVNLLLFGISMLALLVLGFAAVRYFIPGRAAAPSRTPLPSATASVARTATPTASPTAEPALAAVELATPDAETQAAMQVIAEQVTALRGLTLSTDVQSAMVPQSEAALILASAYFDENRALELQNQEQILRALGLIGEGSFLTDYELRRHTDPLGGFYIQFQNRIYLEGEGFSGAMPFQFARLLGRALIASTLAQVEQASNGCSPFSDACRALRALVQGDASLAGDQWLQSHGAAEVQQAVDELTAEPPSGEQASPGFAAMDLNFPGQYGPALAEAAFASGGWGGVDALYASPPVSSEQLMHAEKFSAGEGPAQMSEASFGPAFGSGWDEVQTGELGEWLTFLILAHGAGSEAQLEAGLAAAAAAGWGGDRFQAFARQSDAAVALAAHWVMDSEADAGQLGAALESYVAARFGEEASALGGGNCWAALGQRSCVYARGVEVLWLVGPDEIVVLQVMLTHFPQFQ
ncbi:MAG: hypothetical protein WEA61_09300 [Anaerolineales bacterium]